MTLSGADVGRRVIVRRRLAGQRGPTGGPAFSDVLGTLEYCDDDHLVVRRADGSPVRIALAEVAAAKPVPPPPERRSRTQEKPASPDDQVD